MTNWELPPGDTGGGDFHPEFGQEYSSQFIYSHAPPPPYSRSSNDYMMYASSGNYPPPTTSTFQSLPRQSVHHHVHCHPMPERATQTLPRTAQDSPKVRKAAQCKAEEKKKEGFLASLKRKLTITKKAKPRKEKWEKNGKARCDGPGPVMTSTPVTSCSRQHSIHQRSAAVLAPLQRSISCGGEHSLSSSHMPPSSCTSGSGWSPVIGKEAQNYRTSALRQQQQQRWSFAGAPPPPQRPLSQNSAAAPCRPASVTGYQEHGIYPQSLRERELAFLHQDQDISYNISDCGYPDPVYGSLATPVPPSYHQHYDTLSQYSSDPSRSLHEYSQGARHSFTSQSSSASQYSTSTGCQNPSTIHMEARLLNTSQQVPVHYTSSRGHHYGFLQPELNTHGRQSNPGEGLYVLPVSSLPPNSAQRKTGCECPMCYHSGHNICGVCGCPSSIPPIPSPSVNSSNTSQPPALPPKYRHSLSAEPRLGRPQSMSSRSIEAIYSTSLENPSFKGSLSDLTKVTHFTSRIDISTSHLICSRESV